MSQEPEKTAPRYRIGLVSRLTGISTHQLRVWERRYKTVTPGRSKGGDRLYSDRDVERLRTLKKLNDLGHSIGRIASLSEAELGLILQEHAPGVESRETSLMAQRVVDQFLVSVARMDVLEAERTLSRASVAFEPQSFVLDVLLPIMREVGERWARGEFSVAQEHGASSVLRTQLGALMRLYAPEVGARVVVSATLASELHEFGALAAALSAASRGWKVVYLGPNLPAAEIVNAVEASRAEMLLISIVLAQPTVSDELILLARRLPKGVRVILGGSGATGLDVPAGMEVMESIERLSTVL